MLLPKTFIPFMKQISFLLSLLLISLGLVAQTGNIGGKITDTSGKKPMSLATVTVFKAKDTAIITYRLSSPEGEFKIPNLPLDIPLRFMVTYSGYEAYRKDFILTAANVSIRFDSVMLTATSKQLDDVIVYAERPPVMIKKDTIEFNATAFKTLPNALVEDLLKKLPGVQVDKDGNITVAGKPVNRILVDGKTFFGDDPKMATRNLPANVIDKVQVVDDKEELLRNGDDNLNNVGKVINIKLKKGVKKGWFGKLYAGGGTGQLFETGGIANIYRDTFQVSVLGYANNLNKPGFSFSELMQSGGLDRTRSNLNSNSTSTWNNNGGSGISINGINFGGSQNYGGVSTSKGVGINLNHAPNLKQSLFAQYFYGRINVDRHNGTDVNQYSADTIINNNTQLTGDVITNAHNIGLGGRFKPDSLTNITANANYSIGLSDEDRLSSILSNNNKLGQLSYGNINQNNLGTTYYYRHSFSLTHLSKTKAGRRFSISHNLDVNNRFNELTTESQTRYLYPAIYDSTLNQLRKERIPRTDANLAIAYSEPLSKVVTLRSGARYEYGKLTNSINTFNKNTNQEYDIANNNLSSKFNREYNRETFSQGVEFKWKSLVITPTARLLIQSVNNNLASLSAPIIQKQTNLLPSLYITYKTLNVSYDKNVTLTPYTNLIPVTDNTNPYFISKGNPNLLPAERHNFSINYFTNNPKKNFTASVYANGGLTNNDVVQSISINENGVQTNMPVNANGSSNFYLNFNVYKQYKTNQKFIFSWNTGASYNYNRNKLLYNGETSWQSTISLNNWVGTSLNWNDKVEFNSSFSTRYGFTDYTNPNFNKLKINTCFSESELIIRAVKHLIFETQLAYDYNGNLPAGLPKESLKWSAAINITMLPDEVGVLKLGVNDILNRNNQVYAYVNRNTYTATTTNILSRYFLATFTYNIRAAGVKKKVGGRERLFFF